MSTKQNAQLTPLELAIMNALWDLGPAPVQRVQEVLAAQDRKLAYTTVQTLLNVLLRKKKVKRTMVDRAFWYKPALSRQRAIGTALADIVDRLFDGSAEALVMS